MSVIDYKTLATELSENLSIPLNVFDLDFEYHINHDFNGYYETEPKPNCNYCLIENIFENWKGVKILLDKSKKETIDIMLIGIFKKHNIHIKIENHSFEYGEKSFAILTYSQESLNSVISLAKKI